MRKQYHLLPTDHGLDVWDVDRLIALSRNLPVQRVPLDSIRDLDDPYWFHDRAVQPTVREVVGHVRLIEAVDPSYPIILGSDGRVMDGMHRVARALLDGRTTIDAVQFEVDPEPDHRNCDPQLLSYEESPGPDTN